MKQFTITIRGECDDDVQDDWLHQMAGAAEVQVLEPEVTVEDDWNPQKFTTMNVTTHLDIKDALHHKYDWYAFDSWTVKQQLIAKAQRSANRTRDRGMVHAHSGEEQCTDECVLIVPQ